MNAITEPRHVLLIEDDEDHAEAFRCAAEDCKIECDITHCNDGEEALNLIARFIAGEIDHRPRVIILDLNIPKRNGLEILRSIKADAAVASIPVVILTTSSSDDDRTNAYDAHANSYLAKPIDYERFNSLVEETLRYWLTWNTNAPT